MTDLCSELPSRPGLGRGLCAARDIEPGEVLFDESPVFVQANRVAYMTGRVCETCLAFLGPVEDLVFSAARAAGVADSAPAGVREGCQRWGPASLPAALICSCGALHCSPECRARDPGHAAVLCSPEAQARISALRRHPGHDALNLSLAVKILASGMAAAGAGASASAVEAAVLAGPFGRLQPERMCSSIFRQTCDDDSEENRAAFCEMDLAGPWRAVLDAVAAPRDTPVDLFDRIIGTISINARDVFVLNPAESMLSFISREEQAASFAASFAPFAEAVKQGLARIMGETDDHGARFPPVSGTGIFPRYAFLNHSCRPTCGSEVPELQPDGSRRLVAPLASLSARGKVYVQRSVKKGEELTTAYIDPALSFKERREQLFLGYGFLCNCQRCDQEGGLDTAQREF
jgi:hypothetical protein